MSDERFDAEPVLRGLKGFQQETVEHVFAALHDSEGSNRFLVADETGLGKSIVARGLVAKTIEKLQDEKDDRIDIVYVCSNMDLARQNIGRLNVTGEQEVAFSSRLTLLGQHSARLNNRKGRRTYHGKLVNLISFTPSTSFDPGHATGQARERALLVLVLEQVLEMSPAQRDTTTELLRANVSTLARMRYRVKEMEEGLQNGIDQTVLEEFRSLAETSSGSGRPSSLKRFREVLGGMTSPDQVTTDHRHRIFGVTGALRHDLAKAGIATLKPDLIILDEFQRFRPLLSQDNDAGALAHDLFSSPSAKVVLLSATPYKPFTYAEEVEDHAQDFLRTIRFLHNESSDEAPATERVATHLADYRRAVTSGLDASDPAEVASAALLRVMCRNERPRIDEAGITPLVTSADAVTGNDLAAYVRLKQLADLVSPKGGLVGIDYWKSAPYFVTFCSGYRLRDRIKECEAPELSEALRATQHLTRAQVQGRHPIDFGNARLRQLGHDLIEGGLWRLLWMPPSLPYLTPSGPYADLDSGEVTKRLVFSAWTATPASVASLLSHEVDRRIHEASTGSGAERGQSLPAYKGLSDAGRPQSMTNLMMLWPMPGLARLTDPREHGRRHGVTGHDAFVESTLDAVATAFGTTESSGDETSTEDAQRSWQSAFAHTSTWPTTDRARDAIIRAMAPTAKSTEIDHQRDETEAPQHLRDHVDYAFSHTAPQVLRDEDTRILAEVGAFSPANICWRVLDRLFGEMPTITGDGLMAAAAALAAGVRALFNTPHGTAVVRLAGSDASDRPKWRRLLDYAAMGNLEAALEEWLFNRRNEMASAWSDNALLQFAHDEAAAISLRTSTLQAFDASAPDSERPVIPFPMRFAVRYGARDASAADDPRLHEVRASFNSPFWPFVLVSTSVGQEGIDFHWWCHAVMHWNTPPNPVDFEQREGRVDRFRGHAIRKNIAAKHGERALRDANAASPWPQLFELATDLRKEHGHFTPDWVYPGPARIQRHVAPYTMSRDQEQYDKVVRDVALYRLALGQPRQEDMLALLRRQVEEGVEPARIDLRPGGRQRGR